MDDRAARASGISSIWRRVRLSGDAIASSVVSVAWGYRLRSIRVWDSRPPLGRRSSEDLSWAACSDTKEELSALARLRKDSPSVGDVHVSTALGNERSRTGRGRKRRWKDFKTFVGQ